MTITDMVTNAILKATASFEAANKKYRENQINVTREQRISNAATKVGGCQSDALFNLLEAIIEKKLPPPTKRFFGLPSVPKGLLVMPKAAGGMPRLYLQDSTTSAYNADGLLINIDQDNYRPATKTEIKAFVRSMSVKMWKMTIENLF